MSQAVELHLVPTPGAKPEFLCAIKPIPKDGNTNNHNPPRIWQSIVNSLNKVIVLEGYTRESWATDMNGGTWSSFQVQSVDGRNKLPGFVKYLRERQKTCFGRFVMDDHKSNTDNTNTKQTTFVWVISYKQTSSSRLSCRVAPINSIPNCNLRQKTSSVTVPPGRNRPRNSEPTAKSKPKKKGFGLLGNLVGAQRRTNNQVVTASIATAPKSKTKHSMTSVESHAESNDDETPDHPTGGANGNSANETQRDDSDLPLTTSAQVLSDFRREMEQKMLDFDISPEMSIKIFVRLADHTKKVREVDKGKISMEVLKYIVYEQAEEVNDDWIAQKEPGEFTDEITVAIYKDAESAPPEVIEEMNAAEIPEEMKAQQKMIEQKQRQQEINARRIQEALQRQALRKMAGGGEGKGPSLSVLNTEKRDLRTIEEIQQDSAKRRKME
ncbi:unnamed protein product [Pseudo-nitzschia multistriata]|uniref:Uncharacterized protein n=1 Tax=Pseudo-nitzschia multistriata TaxID=183589 RepID=A0A448ZDC5_9STRA|nr:unnamed protein product [Pseudo-nitzschia multistriata]